MLNILVALGIITALVGVLLVAVGRRLAGYLTSQPMHREGDALFVYIAGAGYLTLIMGLILTGVALALRFTD